MRPSGFRALLWGAAELQPPAFHNKTADRLAKRPSRAMRFCAPRATNAGSMPDGWRSAGKAGAFPE